MKVLDLQCSHSHRFEGWFASDNDFESQLSCKSIECPICADGEISRIPSAPRLNLSSAARSVPRNAESEQLSTNETQARLLRMLREVLANTENVGERFAEEARRIYYNETPARSICGVTTPKEAKALIDEGIDVMSLPVPHILKEPLQ